MNSIPRFTYTAPSKQQTGTAIKEALTTDLPSDLTNIITDYVHEDIDYRLVSRSLEFDRDGRVTNPEVRAAYKAVLKSPFVPPAVKSQLFATLSDSYHPSWIAGPFDRHELAAMTREIISEGDRVELSDVEISQIHLDLNLRDANLRGATIRNSTITSRMTHADLTGAQFINVVFDGINMDHAVTTGMKMIGCFFSHVSITGTKITDPKLLKLVCKGLELFRPDGEPEELALRLHGHTDSPLPKLSRSRSF